MCVNSCCFKGGEIHFRLAGGTHALCKHTGTRGVCLLMLRQHDLLPTCILQLLTPECKCMIIVSQASHTCISFVSSGRSKRELNNFFSSLSFWETKKNTVGSQDWYNP